MSQLSCEDDAGYGPCGQWEDWSIDADGHLLCQCGHRIMIATEVEATWAEWDSAAQMYVAYQHGETYTSADGDDWLRSDGIEAAPIGDIVLVGGPRDGVVVA